MKELVVTLATAIALTSSAADVVKLSGIVTSGGVPVEGVPVTDGRQVVVTDARGRYEMKSSDDVNYVYLTIPSGYEVPMFNNVPTFYREVIPDDRGRFRADFTLEKSSRDMSRHLLFVMADPQVYFDTNFSEVNKAAVEMKQLVDSAYNGMEAVGVIVGDIVGQIKDGDKYFPCFIDNMGESKVPFFYVCGNHDIDMSQQVNEGSRHPFNKFFGPSWYSFNRGKVHYVVLDDIYWMGRYYAGYYPAAQLEWLKQDLSLVPKGSTVIIAQHIPCYSRAARAKQWTKEDPKKIVSNRQALFNLLKGYNAHIMSGHEHYNENFIISDSIYEHCHAPLSTLFWCAPWAMDGTPGGYAVYEIDGDKIDGYYKSVGRNRDYQFSLYPRGLSREHPEAVVANIWNYDPRWKVEWYENGTLGGEMTQFTGYDPNIYNDVATNGKNYAFPYIGSDLTEHLFYCLPSSLESVITVIVTDGNGHVYKQEINQKEYK